MPSRKQTGLPDFIDALELKKRQEAETGEVQAEASKKIKVPDYAHSYVKDLSGKCSGVDYDLSERVLIVDEEVCNKIEDDDAWKIVGYMAREEYESERKKWEALSREREKLFQTYEDSIKRMIGVYDNFLDFLKPELDRLGVKEDLKQEIVKAERFSCGTKPKLSVIPLKHGELYTTSPEANYELITTYETLKKWTGKNVDWNDKNVEFACKKVRHTLNYFRNKCLVTLNDKLASKANLKPSKLIKVGEEFYNAVGFILYD